MEIIDYQIQKIETKMQKWRQLYQTFFYLGIHIYGSGLIWRTGRFSVSYFY